MSDLQQMLIAGAGAVIVGVTGWVFALYRKVSTNEALIAVHKEELRDVKDMLADLEEKRSDRDGKLFLKMDELKDDIHAVDVRVARLED